MGSIKENLQKILSAVYGRDVRQAIHDSIEQCEKDMENGIAQCREAANLATDTVQKLLDNLIQPVTFTVTDGIYWDYVRGSVADNPNTGTQSVKLPASPGETYKVRCHKGDGNTMYVAYPIIAVSGISGEASGMAFKGLCEKPLAAGGEIYIYTVPEGADGLLVNHVKQSSALNFDIEIYKLRV